MPVELGIAVIALGLGIVIWVQMRAARVAQQTYRPLASRQPERQQAELAYREEIAALRSRGLDREASEKMITRKIINRFQASSFGIWNCDRPLPPFVARVKGDFKDADHHEYARHTAFLVNQNRITVARFHARPGAPVSFETQSDNLMWLVTPDNKIALFRPEKFRKINRKKGDYTFVLNVIDKAIQREEDVRRILEL